MMLISDEKVIVYKIARDDGNKMEKIQLRIYYKLLMLVDPIFFLWYTQLRLIVRRGLIRGWRVDYPGKTKQINVQRCQLILFC